MTSTLMEPPDMADKPPSTRTVRLPDDLVAMLPDIEDAAKRRGERFRASEYLAAILRPRMTADHKKARAFLKQHFADE